MSPVFKGVSLLYAMLEGFVGKKTPEKDLDALLDWILQTEKLWDINGGACHPFLHLPCLFVY